MNQDIAENLFFGRQKGQKRLNCAQAIAQTFKSQYNFITEQTIAEFKKMGHGKAPDGHCGMLYAAKFIFEHNGQPEKAKEFEGYFKEIAGSTKCSDIIKKKITFCAACLRKTAEFIDKQNNKQL